MALATVAEFVDALRRHALLDSTRLHLMETGALGHPTDVVKCADALMKRGWLTPLQSEYLLAGRGADLVLGPYVLLERIGKGGMGEVYKARQERLGRTVALKVIRPEHLPSPEAVGRFRREARAAALLQHPNVVTIYDADEANGNFFIAMECVEGTDLSKLVRQRGPLPLHEACDCVRQAALGLQHAHEQGLVHRDIKPSNLIVTRASAPEGGGGLVKVLDFGLARTVEPANDGVETPSDHWIGTPDFIAPEQARNAREVDIRADIFSLGCALYYLLSGKSPFPGNSRVEKLLARMEGDMTPLSTLRQHVPGRLDAVLCKMLAREPRDRYQTPAEAARALEEFSRPTTSNGAFVPGPAHKLTPADEKSTASVAHGRANSTPNPYATPWESGQTPPLTPVQTPPPQTGTRTSMLTTTARRVPAVAWIAVALLIAGLAALPFVLGRKPPHDPPVPPPKESFVNSLGMKFVRIPAGAFFMGAPADEADHEEDEVPQHPADVKQPFYLGAHEVTQENYEAVMGVNPSFFSPHGKGALRDVADTKKHPVDSVSWLDATEFCRRLTERERTEGRSYRLPTETEWEFACRANTTTPFHYGAQLSAAEANIDGERPYGGAAQGANRMKTMPVGSFEPNAFGLYDMHGNVLEWCQDRYVSYAKKLQPGGPGIAGDGRVLRGGARDKSGAECRCAKRYMQRENAASMHSGFRVVCEP